MYTISVRLPPQTFFAVECLLQILLHRLPLYFEPNILPIAPSIARVSFLIKTWNSTDHFLLFPSLTVAYSLFSSSMSLPAPELDTSISVGCLAQIFLITSTSVDKNMVFFFE